MVSKFKISLFQLFVPFCIISKQTNAQSIPTRQSDNNIVNTYSLISPFGHQIDVEMDYSIASTGYINNDGKAQYIVTNTGTKDIVGNLAITQGSVIINKVKFDSTFQIRGIIFEFTTSDNKQIEIGDDIFLKNELQVGKTTQAETVHIDAGKRYCTSVKPVRFKIVFSGLALAKDK